MFIPNSKQRRGPWAPDAASSKAVIKKEAQGIAGGGQGANERTIVLASTERAMRLRNGKGGSFGTGELVRISGREKLELIAEDEMQKLRAEKKKVLYESDVGNAVRAPFNMEVALKVAQSQMDLYIDLVNQLHKKALCYDRLKQEIEAQVPKDRGPKDPDPMRIASFVAEQFGVCIHNAYMMASGWTIIFESLRFLQNAGLADKMATVQLKNEERFRTVYVLAFQLLQKLVDSGQQRLRSIVQNTEHFRVYFRMSTASKDRQEFDDTEMRKMYKSFLDSTIIELCLPGSKFSHQALYSCLHAIEEESPKDLRRCPQLMWDCVGDLAEAVRLMDLMETPLLDAEGVIQAQGNPEEVPEFAQWERAQELSIKAALQYSSFVNLVFPLENLQNELTLSKAWDKLNANYIKESGKSIDVLWQLIDVRQRVPHFSILYISEEALNANEDASAKKPLTIKANGEESDSSMPPLVPVSDSEEEVDDTDSSDDSIFSSDDINDDGNDDEAYDTEEEEELKKLFREAMDFKTVVADELDPEETSKSQNPFLKLLGNLKGRIFSPSSALRTDGKTTQTTRPVASKAGKRRDATDKILSEYEKQFAILKSEEGDDESDEPKTDKKKKKKPKKKKKKATTGDDSIKSPIAEEDTEHTISNEIVESPTKEEGEQLPPVASPSSTVPPPSSPAQKKKKGSRPSSIKTPSIASEISGTTAYGSTTSLPLPTPSKAESARTYVKSLSGPKEKVKTRPDQPADEMERRMFLPKFGSSKKPKEAVGEAPEGEEKKDNSASIFTKLKGKTTKLATRFFGVGDSRGKLRWEQFLQIMRELGFDYDPSTAGSSVRFDPPNPNDRSITFHKPHPDSTLYAYKIKEYRDKLAEYYDWTPDKFQKALDEVRARSSKD